nr:MAG TPA_asm: Putative amidoligase enzyme [Caudoviricetes sp.]
MHLNEFSISQLTGVRVVQDVAPGEYSRLPLRPDIYMGIEIEGEGAHIGGALNAISTLGWSLAHDDSLRHDGMELVLTAPLNGERLASAISGLFSLKEDGDVEWHASPRAGTHFHMNVSDRNVGFVQAITALAYCVDELIFSFADEDRKWCSYCNSLNTLPTVVLRSLLVNRQFESYNGWTSAWPISSRDRYYGFNLSSISKFGTVELRYFPTPDSEQQVWDWLDMCQSLFSVAEDYEDREDPARAVLDDLLEDPAAILARLPMLASIQGAADSVKAAAEELDTTLSYEEDHAGSMAQPTGISLDTLLQMRQELRDTITENRSSLFDNLEEF